MEMETVIRFVLLFIGAIVILFILWDGLHRKKQRQKHQTLLNINSEQAEKDFQEIILSDQTEKETLAQDGSSEKEISNQSIPVEQLMEEKADIKLDKFISIHLVPKENKRFGGYDLLQTILANNFHYGDLQLFHYFENNNRANKKLFSLASAEEPGDFDLGKMGTFSTNGLILYMKISDHEDPKVVFDQMMNIAEQLADDLEVDLKIANNEPWTEAITISIRDQLVKPKVLEEV